MALTTVEAAQAIGMIDRGDKQHDVAAWFGVNQARIAEAQDGKFGTTEPCPPSKLPPSGAPGIKGRKVLAATKQALELIEQKKYTEAAALLQSSIDKFYTHE